MALRTVNLAWNGFGFEGCLAIGDMLSSNHTITELDLACNRINPPALLELLRGLTANKTLRILRVGGAYNDLFDSNVNFLTNKTFRILRVGGAYTDLVDNKGYLFNNEMSKHSEGR